MLETEFYNTERPFQANNVHGNPTCFRLRGRGSLTPAVTDSQEEKPPEAVLTDRRRAARARRTFTTQVKMNKFNFGNDPSAGSPTETLLRLLLPLNDQV